ncbi:MAG: hypothetical protein QOG43_698 [Actinomycetota bacterium]|nr:hypothetical protein [Actinomycetota bacterium]
MARTTPDTEPTVARRSPGAGAGFAAAGFTAAAIAGVGLSWAIATGGDILAARGTILARLAVWSVVWTVAVACAMRLPRRVALPAIFVVAVALRLAALAGPPVLSDDLYRYAWDGRVQAAGIDPYRYPPTSAQLRSLREPWLWPDDAGCAKLGRGSHCSRINRATVRTIYPPVAQAWFATVYRLSGIGHQHKAWQAAGLVGDVALVGLLPFVLRAWRRDERWTALYALSPFPVVEVVNNGHVDGLAALLVVAALLAAAHRRPAWAGALIGAATLVKLYPALLVVGLAGTAAVASTAGRRGWWRRRDRQSWRSADLVRAGAAAATVIVVGYLPHVLAVGVRVLGYLPGYLREEKYDSGGRFLLASLLHLPIVPAAVVAGAGLAAVIAWVLRTRPCAPRAFAALIGALLLATTPVQPWYAVTLLAAATVAVAPVWALVAAAAYPYFFAVILDSPHTIAIGRISYGLALAGVVASAVITRGRAHGRPPPDVTAAGAGGDAGDSGGAWPTRRTALVVSAALAVLLIGPVAGAVRPQRAGAIPHLPVLGPSRDAYDGDLGDPFILPVPGAGFVAFGTGDWPARVPTASTPDLVTWHAGPDALPDLPRWAAADPRNSHSWAPAVRRIGDQFVLYVTLPEARSGRQCIAAATAATPEGPYVDEGEEPMVCQRELGGSIDPSVVADRDGSLHLLWKNDGNCCQVPARLWEQAMTADGLHVTGDAHPLLTAAATWQGGIVENPAAIPASDGGWWLFYSGNRFDVVDYATGVAWCPTLQGPCVDTRDEPFLATEGTRWAPGGLETFRDDAGDLWAVYDTWNRPARNGRFYCCRSLYLARILAS